MLEQDEDGRYITSTFFEKHAPNISLDFVNAGTELLARLEQCRLTRSRYPSLILLNYHHGPVTAIDTLRQLKSRAEFSHIPAVVLSGSTHEQAVRECYAAGASSFIQKPFGNDETHSKILTFIRYWFETAELA